MIEPRPAQRGVIGEAHGLTKLTDTLEALTRGQTAQQQRDGQLQEHLTTQASMLRWQRWGMGVLLGLLLVVSGLVGWQVWHPPQLEYARALGAIDQAIVQQWGSLPKTIQEALSSTYGRLRLQSPGERLSPKK